jgi:hypothetical protein
VRTSVHINDTVQRKSRTIFVAATKPSSLALLQSRNYMGDVKNKIGYVCENYDAMKQFYLIRNDTVVNLLKW